MVMIDVIGIGPGNPAYCLVGQLERCEQADAILGSERHLEVLPESLKEKGVIAPKKLGELESLLAIYPLDSKLVYLVSGDPLIYGLGKWMSEKFPGRVRILSGISSMQYLASKVCLPMNDAYLTSSHAKLPNFDLIMSLPKVFMVTDAQVGPYRIAQEVLKRGLKRKIIIGEQLSYEDEEISILAAEDVVDRDYKMNVVVIVDEG
ncbi:cobalt-precorrin-7 (C(5))-methyltransferase [Streptococcus suis]|uniref:Cobalt-precorrin-7 (C(5))-methyltransferase n=1 Tax=Streptococcus suis TaxID=1307 RepID=A0A9X4RSR0_STRSU|nr:cobalt-precorrin-7 (C(5))-methyltransferase [Streptococcus suis]MBY5024850.1 cobalt-precorrin-7 (C(5))-methyltransferase [Streptococcus suis]MCK3935760.1 cobalt-precorrin-7 (C(5))-methyltransferase [Streptococcus suis]MDG4526244.1 cobalt-precorrin-7 (C(5))-methyltransferase [Streptococcus suis]MDG4528807.1 cobalt-precorrin-7 (C(5))-methyltransferase [Streptococcus suis]NQK80960.1 cobalt-precorrin-7 (C(5))-methyltransferase [Streptococcus suis]